MAVAVVATHWLLFQVIGLLSGNLILKILYMLLGFCDVDGDVHQRGLISRIVSRSHRMLLLQILQMSDLLQELIEQNQRLRRQGLV